MVKVTKIDTPEPSKHTKKSLTSLGVFKRWYTRKPVIITLLIFLFPVGLALMWKFAVWTKKTRWVVTGVTALLVILGAIGIYNSTPSIVVNNTKGNKINTDDREYTLMGRVSTAKGVANLTIDGRFVSLTEDSEFSYKVSLEEGDNTFNLASTNENGTYEKSIQIHRTTQAEFAARAESEKLKADKNTNKERKTEAPAQKSTNSDAFYINNAYYKGDSKYDVVVYSSSKDTLQIYINDKNPVKTKVNDEGWATFKNIKLSGRSKLSFAKKVGWIKYSPVNYVKYISVGGKQVKLMDAAEAVALDKADAEAKAAAEAKAQAEAQAQHNAYIGGLAKTYCSNHAAWRKIYVPQSTSKDAWDNPNKDLVTTNPKQSDCVTIMTFFVDVMLSEHVDNIVNKKVAVDMNRAEVLASWGWPNNNSNYSSSLGSSDTWNYNTGTCYYGICPNQQYVNFYNGKVTSTGNY